MQPAMPAYQQQQQPVPVAQQNGCEPETNCCFCFPIGTGFKIYGIVFLIEYFIGCFLLGYYGATGIVVSFNHNNYGVGVGIILVIAFYILFFGYLADFWKKWLKVDDETTRTNLITFFKINFVMQIIFGVLSVLGTVMVSF